MAISLLSFIVFRGCFSPPFSFFLSFFFPPFSKFQLS